MAAVSRDQGIGFYVSLSLLPQSFFFFSWKNGLPRASCSFFLSETAALVEERQFLFFEAWIFFEQMRAFFYPI